MSSPPPVKSESLNGANTANASGTVAPKRKAVSQSRACFLVKIPKYLADHVRAVSADASADGRSIEIGQLFASRRADDKLPELQLKIHSQANDLPRDYSLAALNTECFVDSSAVSSTSSSTTSAPVLPKPPFYVFHEKVNAARGVEGASLDGPVTTYFVAKPDNTPEYRAMNKARLQRSLAPKRTLQQISTAELDASLLQQTFDQSRQPFTAAGAVGRSGSSNLGGVHAAPTVRRVRDAERIGPDILAAYSERPYWRVELLAERVNQPVDFVKENLQIYAVQIREGEFRTHWELKEQYRTAVPPPSSSASASSSMRR